MDQAFVFIEFIEKQPQFCCGARLRFDELILIGLIK